MRVFVAGATGAIGAPLVSRLISAGHQVTGMTRSARRTQALREAGAEAVVADAFDADGLTRAVTEARPDAVVHQLTALPENVNPRHMADQLETHDRLRVEGTRNLVAAARAAGAARLVAQSIAFAYSPPAGEPARAVPHRESDPLYLDAFEPWRRSVQAVQSLEQTVMDAGGVVLRYGWLYGPRTGFAAGGAVAEMVSRRRFPLAGRRPAVWSFLHVDDAAAAVLPALEFDGPGVFNIVDDQPAPVSGWLPALADLLGAPRPRRVPLLVARVAGGPHAVFTMSRMGGASNQLAHDGLGWRPAYPSWRRGFARVFGASVAPES